jgi:hypothetical protein
MITSPPQQVFTPQRQHHRVMMERLILSRDIWGLCLAKSLLSQSHSSNLKQLDAFITKAINTIEKFVLSFTIAGIDEGTQLLTRPSNVLTFLKKGMRTGVFIRRLLPMEFFTTSAARVVTTAIDVIQESKSYIIQKSSSEDSVQHTLSI